MLSCRVFIIWFLQKNIFRVIQSVFWDCISVNREYTCSHTNSLFCFHASTASTSHHQEDDEKSSGSNHRPTRKRKNNPSITIRSLPPTIVASSERATLIIYNLKNSATACDYSNQKKKKSS